MYRKSIKSNFPSNKSIKNKKIQALCSKMCPDDEYDLRTKHNMVHQLEKKKISSSKFEYVLVKEYGRPAAGRIIKSNDLRGLDVLRKTTEYLVDEVYKRSDVDFFTKYEFIFDRLRAIRQDITILGFHDEQAVRIYEIILAFYLLADYKLCNTKMYDEYINMQHLNEVLQFIISNENCRDKPLFFSVFVLLNLNNSLSITNLLKQYKFERTQSPLVETISLLKAYVQKNYVQVFRVYRKLPLVCQLAFHRRIPKLQMDLINRMSFAFPFKYSSFPLDNFLELSLFNEKSSLDNLVKQNLLSIENERVLFYKKSTEQPVDFKECRERLRFIDEKLENINESEFLNDCAWMQ